VLASGCAPRPGHVPASPSAEERKPVQVVELIDRRDEARPRRRGRADAAVTALADESFPLPAYERLLGGPGPLSLIVGQGPREPAPGIIEELEARLALLEETEEGSSRGPVTVVVAAPDLSGGRYSGLCDLLREQEPEAPVALAVLDLGRPAEPGDRGWGWEAHLLLAGTDPVAVDRVGLRILDSARRATGAPPLEDLEGPGTRSLAEAERELGGQGRLEGIDWIKVPLTR
jgi:hypothetical protein